jgi:hypothetical protein
MAPYLDALIGKLLALLQRGRRNVQEGALTALAAVADTAEVGGCWGRHGWVQGQAWAGVGCAVAWVQWQGCRCRYGLPGWEHGWLSACIGVNWVCQLAAAPGKPHSLEPGLACLQ